MKVSQYPGLTIGQRVFLAVTPSTHHLFLQHYRPEEYFVLESKVIDITGDGVYRFGTDFFVTPDRIFTKPTDAKILLCKIFEQERGKTLAYLKARLVTHREEQEATDRQSERIHREIVQPQMDTLAQDPHWQ